MIFKKIKELFDSGIIDENEYKAIKEKLIANNFN
ncbi:SHOCT domain-containing protein [Clostridium nigeriense]